MIFHYLCKTINLTFPYKMAKKKKDLWWYIKKEYGLSAMKRKFTKETGIPTTQAGLERKIGKTLLGWILGSGKKGKQEDDNE